MTQSVNRNRLLDSRAFDGTMKHILKTSLRTPSLPPPLHRFKFSRRVSKCFHSYSTTFTTPRPLAE
jgi:hypothetical protein